MSTHSGLVDLTTCRVLVVEDEYLLASEMSATLEEAGAKVVGPFGTLAHASAMPGEDGIDCAVVDVRLRNEMAFPLLDRLIADGVPTILVTGYEREALPEAYHHLPILQKPVRERVIAAAIEMARRASLVTKPRGWTDGVAPSAST